MSVTSRTYNTVSMYSEDTDTKVTVKGNANGGTTTITSIILTQSSNSLFSVTVSNMNEAKCTIDGTKYSWIVDSTQIDGVTVTKAHVSLNNLKIQKPFFDIDFGNKIFVSSGKFFSFYDLGKKDYYELGAFECSSYVADNRYINGSNKIKLSINESSYYGGLGADCKIDVVCYVYTPIFGDRENYEDQALTWKYHLECSPTNGRFSVTDVIPTSVWNSFTDCTRLSVWVKVKIYIADTTLCEFRRGAYSESNGNSTYYFYLPDSVVPTISSVTLNDPSGRVPSSWSAYIQHISKVGVSAITASGTYSATIDKVALKLESNGTAISNVSGTLSSLPKTAVINYYGTFDVTVTVTDSRGRSASKSAKVTFLSYSAPVITGINTQRCLKDGTTDNDGTYALAAGTPVYSSCNGKNSYKMYVSYKRTDTSAYGSETEVTSFPVILGSGDFDPEYSYDIRYRISDQFNTNYFVDYLSTAIMLMHFMREGRGVAFGGKSTVQNCMDVIFNAVFRGNVGFEINKKFYTIEDIISKCGATANDTLDWIDDNTKDFS